MIIDLTIKMDEPHAKEAQREFIHTVEMINQDAGDLGEIERGQMQYLARCFNEGKLKIEGLKTALVEIYRQSINRAQPRLKRA